MGRVAFWLTFGLAYYRWLFGQDIPSSHEAILVIVLGYVLGGKIAAQYAGRKITGEGKDE
jgi:hypothetical protein